MPSDRFYRPGPLTVGNNVLLEGPEELHMRRVMRTKPGDTVELFNGTGTLASAILLTDGTLKVTAVSHEPPPPQIIIAQAIIAPSKLDWLTEKCQELGASALWLFPGELSEKKSVNIDRLKTLAINAAKQSGRLYLMDIVLKTPLKEWPSYNNLYYGSTKKEAPRFKPLSHDFIFVIGPEKGLTAKEESLLTKGVSLSPAILRTETAALVVLAQEQFL